MSNRPEAPPQLTVIIEGDRRSGKTALAVLLHDFLSTMGYSIESWTDADKDRGERSREQARQIATSLHQDGAFKLRRITLAERTQKPPEPDQTAAEQVLGLLRADRQRRDLSGGVAVAGKTHTLDVTLPVGPYNREEIHRDGRQTYTYGGLTDQEYGE